MSVAADIEKPKRDRREEYREYYRANHEKRLESQRSYRKRNRSKVLAAVKKWSDEHPEQRREYIRASQTKRRYGITRAVHDALYEAQQHRCAICRINQDQMKRRFCVDHDHETGKVRGLLCFRCNIVIGHARENPTNLKAAIAYLEMHDGK